MKPLADKECINCNKPFTPIRKWAIYCSKSCQMQHFYEKRTTFIETLEEENARLKEELLKLSSGKLKPKTKKIIKLCGYCKKNIDINDLPDHVKSEFFYPNKSAGTVEAYFCNNECESKYIKVHTTYTKLEY